MGVGGRRVGVVWCHARVCVNIHAPTHIHDRPTNARTHTHTRPYTHAYMNKQTKRRDTLKKCAAGVQAVAPLQAKLDEVRA